MEITQNSFVGDSLKTFWSGFQTHAINVRLARQSGARLKVSILLKIKITIHISIRGKVKGTSLGILMLTFQSMWTCLYGSWAAFTLWIPE